MFDLVFILWNLLRNIPSSLSLQTPIKISVMTPRSSWYDFLLIFRFTCDFPTTKKLHLIYLQRQLPLFKLSLSAMIFLISLISGSLSRASMIELRELKIFDACARKPTVPWDVNQVTWKPQILDNSNNLPLIQRVAYLEMPRIFVDSPGTFRGTYRK